MAGVQEKAETGPVGLVRRAIEWWALLGGFVLLGIALLTAWSAATGFIFGKTKRKEFKF